MIRAKKFESLVLLESQCQEKIAKIKTSENSHVVNVLVMNELGKNLHQKKVKNCMEKVTKLVNGIYQFCGDFSQASKLKAERVLASESTASGVLPQHTQEIILSTLEEHLSECEVLEPYRLYVKKEKGLENLNKEGDIQFVSLTIPKHHITAIITYHGENDYSLTIVNSGYGADKQPKNINNKYYTRVTYSDINRNKLKYFLQNALNLSLDMNGACEHLYEEIKILDGIFNEEESHVDNLQLGGSCSGRQELLMLKHVMKKEEYQQLKIKLSERALVSQAKTYKAGLMSKDQKVIFLDCVQRLKKRYFKNGQEKMIEVMKVSEEIIRNSLCEDSNDKSQLIPKSPEKAHWGIKLLIEGLRDFQRQDLRQARQKIESFNDKFLEDFSEENNPFLENIEENKDGLKIIIDTLVMTEELIHEKQASMQNFMFSMEQLALLVGFCCAFDRYFVGDVNKILESSDQILKEKAQKSFFEFLKWQFECHDFMKGRDYVWEKSWKTKLLFS